ncbi:hypothetical protein JCM31826_18650 [Thermaurantimonas aggregans]|uniref:DUF4834 domain-containing protein n=1 Tax=Thermaurantimonas aggregans TaxID=2173829 RepID=A0A401XN37_9FLAO|nr:hypothetical protein [Thermaurantimonas aggregans]MCX8149755.1 hypothetical protein [Thermaurantimonas aggregans]GCD78383.1 hypothetical protein JCM31826_18650 [Thermaurantimonas aggregans]
MRFFLSLLVLTYLIIVVYKYFVGPFMEGYNKKSSSSSTNSSSERIKIIYDPNQLRQSNKNVGDYVDYEEVKD